MDQLPILIIGAGVASLTLAQGLHRRSIPFRIFERDINVTARAQGYRFRLDPEGASALEEVFTPELWNLFKRTCGKLDPTASNGLRLNALTGEETEIPQINPGPGGLRRLPQHSYAVDRTTLRCVLLQGLEDYIAFGMEFQSFEEDPDFITAHFSNGPSVKGSLIVGAEGLHSRVRKQLLPDMVPLDAEGRVVYGKTLLTEDFRVNFEQKALERMSLVWDKTQVPETRLLLEAMVFDRSTTCSVPLPDDYVYWVLIMHRDTLIQMNISDEQFVRMTSEEAVKLSKDVTKHWATSIRSLFQHQNAPQTSSIRTLSMHPDIPVWATNARVTFIGDAAHVMPPTGAAGAATAIQDGASLCRKVSGGGICAQSIAKYEQDMRERAKEWITKSLMGAKHVYGMKDLRELKPAVL